MGLNRDEITQNLVERLCGDLSNSVKLYSQGRSQKARTYQASLQLRETVARRKNVPQAAHRDGEGKTTFEPTKIRDGR